MNEGFPGGAVVENLPANAGDTGWIPGQGTKIPQAAGHGRKEKKELLLFLFLIDGLMDSSLFEITATMYSIIYAFVYVIYAYLCLDINEMNHRNNIRGGGY